MAATRGRHPDLECRAVPAREPVLRTSRSGRCCGFGAMVKGYLREVGQGPAVGLELRRQLFRHALPVAAGGGTDSETQLRHTTRLCCEKNASGERAAKDPDGEGSCSPQLLAGGQGGFLPMERRGVRPVQDALDGLQWRTIRGD